MLYLYKDFFFVMFNCDKLTVINLYILFPFIFVSRF